jgi:NADPH:quinone reductase-like Zn-dependent oxidoreductase
MTGMLVRKTALRETRFAPQETTIAAGQALLRLTRFALTANNVTYAAIGDQFGYWKFFPAEDGWGRVPVWGFADVVASNAPELKAGERIWGYYPIASHLVVTPARVTASGFVDGAEHRQGLPPVYNQYERVAADPAYDPRRENEIALFRPLFMTGFLLDDFLDENACFGARRVALASASSKTALSLAKLLKARGGAEVVALTSAANAAFCEKTGFYDRVVTYDAMDALPADAPVTLVDMAGDPRVIDALAERLGDRFFYNCMVGGAHWDARAMEAKGPPRTLFFAPDRIAKRRKDWGAEGLATRYGAAWTGFLAAAESWLTVLEGRGEADVLARWAALLDGKARPEEGYILSL